MLPDFGWSELLVIGIVLIVIVGPKDLPKMLRTFGKTTSSLRKMAGDFRRQFDEALKEAELDDVRQFADDMKGLDPRGRIKDALNPLGKIGEDLNEDLKRAARDIDDATKPPSAAEGALAASGDKMKAAQTATGKPDAGKTSKPKAATAKTRPPAKTGAASKSTAAKPTSTKAGASGATAKAPAKGGSPSRSAPAKSSVDRSAVAKPAASKATGKPSAAKPAASKPKGRSAATNSAARKTNPARSSGDKS